MPLVVRQQTELLLQLKLLEASATTTGMLLLRVVAVAIIAVAADIRHDKNSRLCHARLCLRNPEGTMRI